MLESLLNKVAGLQVLRCKSMDWFLYNNGLRHERVNFSIMRYELQPEFNLAGTYRKEARTE